jgi:hypothetical protein
MRSIGILLAIAILCLISVPAAAYSASTSVTVQVSYSSGQPVYGASVSLQNGNYAYLANGTTDISGTSALNISSGSNVIRARVITPEYNQTTVWYEVGQNTTINVTIPNVEQISGAILLNGMAAGNPVVVLDNDQIYDSMPYNVSQQNSTVVHTFTANSFSFPAAMGKHSLYAAGYYNGIVYMSDPININLTSATGQASVVLQLNAMGNNTSILAPAVYEQIFHTTNVPPAPADMLGWLIGADGKPLADAAMTVQDWYLNNYSTALTDDNGTFAFYGLNISTDILRFKITVQDNGTPVQLFSQFYPTENTYGLKVIIPNYPIATTGFIYGIITNTTNSSNPVPLSGTVYLSNGMTQAVSPAKGQGQFFFNVTPGNYTIYAECDDGGQNIRTGTLAIVVAPAWSPADVDPTFLVLQEQQTTKPIPLAAAIVIGLLCIAGTLYAMRKWF